MLSIIVLSSITHCTITRKALQVPFLSSLWNDRAKAVKLFKILAFDIEKKMLNISQNAT
jgi:hypothetical protein